MRVPWRGIVGWVIVAGSVALAPASLASQTHPVRAVLFFSPTCPHCHQVINEDLPVIFERFGGKPAVWADPAAGPRGPAFFYLTNGELEVLLVDASQQAGGMLYETASQQLAIPPARMGLPRLVVGDSVLVGSLEIPTRFPAMIERARAGGGLDWPAIDGLAEHIPVIPAVQVADATADDTAAGPTAEEPPPQTHAARDSIAATAADQAVPPPAAPPLGGDSAPARSNAAAVTAVDSAPGAAVQSSLEAIRVVHETPWTRFRRDPAGNSMSVIVLLVMAWSLWTVSSRAAGWSARETASFAVPVLAMIGFCVAGYLTYVEMSGALAACGPVGDCNAVQQSPYARVGGMPVGLLGLAGYAGVLVTWGVSRSGPGGVAQWATFALLPMAFVGVLFSVYLTFLEPFVIGATCMWCLTSAVIMTLLLWLVAGSGTRAWRRIRAR